MEREVVREYEIWRLLYNPRIGPLDVSFIRSVINPPALLFVSRNNHSHDCLIPLGGVFFYYTGEVRFPTATD